MATNALFLDMLHNISRRVPTAKDDFVNVGNTERILSAAGGALLTYYGLKNLRSVTGISLALTGVPMLFRAISGFCPVNLALDRDTAHDRTGVSNTATAESKE
jgi:uncharacterized membrane protein